VTAGANPMGLKRGIEPAVEAVTAELKKVSKSTKNKKEIAQVAIASNNDKTIGNLIAEAMEKVDKGGVITVEESKSAETVLDLVEGMQDHLLGLPEILELNVLELDPEILGDRLAAGQGEHVLHHAPGPQEVGEKINFRVTP
jgi:hypothetical protein